MVFLLAAGCTSYDTQASSDTTALDNREEEVEISELETIEGGNLIVETVPEEADISINGRISGTSPRTFDLSQGYYRITAEAQGFKKSSVWIRIKREEKKKIEFTLSPRTGILSVEASPGDAKIYISDRRVEEFPLELPTGKYSVRISRFGYDSREENVTIKEGELTELEMELPPAAAKITDFSVSENRINPRIGGPKTATELSFSLSAPGEITFTVIGPEGEVLEERQHTALFEPHHSYQWPQENGPSTSDFVKAGKDNINALREGSYRLILTVDFLEGPVLTEESEVVLDSRLKPALFSSPLGKSGTLLCSLPPEAGKGAHIGTLPLFFSTFSGVTSVAPGEGMHIPFALFASSRADGRSLTAAAGIEITDSGEDALFTGREVKISLLPSILPNWIRTSAAVSGGYHHAHRRNSFAPSSGGKVSFPTAAGGELLRIVLEPRGGLIYIEESSAEGSVNGTFAGTWGTGAALLLQRGAWAAAASASIDYDSYLPSAPLIKTSAETHVIVPGTGFVVSLYGAGDLSDWPDHFTLGGGVGVSVIK
ncbi:MAG: PEGA domain-containing protein [Spirochaetia bacterium]